MASCSSGLHGTFTDDQQIVLFFLGKHAAVAW